MKVSKQSVFLLVSSSAGLPVTGQSLRSGRNLLETKQETQFHRELDTLDYMADEGDYLSGASGNPYPLFRCQGDCDDDDDCQGNLVCDQREEDDDEVYGCTGTPESDKDYCIDPTPPVDWTEFRLRMVWEFGYNWQESSWEAFWCMQCVGSCRENGQVDISKCDGGNTEFEFLQSAGGQDTIGAAATPGGTRIKVKDEDLCMSLEAPGSPEVILVTCSASNVLQQWHVGQGTVPPVENKFEISPVIDADSCLTQDHHPKEGEMLEVMPCARAHRHQTGYWKGY